MMPDTDLHSILWRNALDLYAAGDPRELARLIRHRTPAPTDPVIAEAVCAIVADVIEGRKPVRSKRGPLPRLDVPREFALRALNHDMRRDGVAEAVRVDRLALQFGMSPSAVRDVLSTVRRGSRVSG